METMKHGDDLQAFVDLVDNRVRAWYETLELTDPFTHARERMLFMLNDRYRQLGTPRAVEEIHRNTGRTTLAVLRAIAVASLVPVRGAVVIPRRGGTDRVLKKTRDYCALLNRDRLLSDGQITVSHSQSTRLSAFRFHENTPVMPLSVLLSGEQEVDAKDQP